MCESSQRLTTTVHFGAYAESVVSSTESEDITSECTEMEDETDDTDSQSDLLQASKKRGKVEANDVEEIDKGPSTIVSEGEASEPEDDVGDYKTKFPDVENLKQQGNSDASKSKEMEQLCNGEASSHSSTCLESSVAENMAAPSTDQLEGNVPDTVKNNHPSSDNAVGDQSVKSNCTLEPPTDSEGRAEGVSLEEGNSARNSNNNSSQSSDTPCELKPSIESKGTPMDTSEVVSVNPLVTPQDGTEGDSVVPPSSPAKPHVEVQPVLGEFELVCDSMDTLRELVDKFAPPESRPATPVTGRKRKVIWT